MPEPSQHDNITFNVAAIALLVLVYVLNNAEYVASGLHHNDSMRVLVVGLVTIGLNTVVWRALNRGAAWLDTRRQLQVEPDFPIAG